MKIKKLGSRGFSHDILLVLFVVVFAISGVAYMVASHADVPITKPAGNWTSLGSARLAKQQLTIAAYSCKFGVKSNVWQVRGYFELSNNSLSRSVHVYIINRGNNPYPGYANRVINLPANTHAQVLDTFVYFGGNNNNFLEYGYSYTGQPAANGIIAKNIRAGDLPTCTYAAPATTTPKPATAPPATAAKPSTPATTTPKPAVAPSPSFFSVKGNRVYYAANGAEYIPYGISVVDDLDQKGWQNYAAASDAQILASAKYWHSNTIRLQVSQNIIATNFSPGKNYNQAAMDRLGAEVDQIEALGKIPVINDCTLFTGNQPAPTTRTLTFWKAVTGYLAARNSTKYANVIFDVFNEPKKGTAQQWQSGGNGYLGMQQVVNTIRSGSHYNNNLIWVEGERTASWLGDLDTYPITGSNVAFAYHHVNINNPSTWSQAAGLTLKTKVPVVDGEWAQYASTRAECYSNGAKNTPTYLAFLRSNHIGMIAWSLEPRVLIQTNNPKKVTDTINYSTSSGYPVFPTTAAGYSQPTHFSSNYACDDAHAGQGAGAEIMAYFKQYSN